ncbi:MAG: phosphonate C-P lyase system protein PhnG [Desulfobacterales bacterium]|jgi:alpha-D-ribose 1-methylphosphonate 5-triphosphate synthase subunit PhnG
MTIASNTPMTRKEWIQVLARSDCRDLEAACRQIAPLPPYRFIRRPETGMVMVRARAGGVGRPFNMGEATLTRCTLQLDEGPSGTAYILGRNPRHAELAALVDALLQDPSRGAELMALVVDPLVSKLRSQRQSQAQKTAATKVEFFTMARGES